MPPKKTNAYFCFMQKEQEDIYRRTKRKPTMKEMANLCIDKWKSLAPAEKAYFEDMAKNSLSSGAGYRKDNQRNLISNRNNELQEEKKRRNQEVNLMMAQFKNIKDLRDIPFVIIDFQVLYDEPLEPHHIPVEVGLVRFTLREGVYEEMHKIINPGEPPQGNRSIASAHSETYHKIPLNFEQGETDFHAIWTAINDFLTKDGDVAIPPLYCLSSNRDQVLNCLGYIHQLGARHKPDMIDKLFCLEDLTTTLLMMSGKMSSKPAESQIYDSLIQNRWDYTNSIRCSFHMEEESSFCSLSIVKRYSFVIFDMLAKVFDFKLTGKHLPDETETPFKIVPQVSKKGLGADKFRWTDQSRPSWNKVVLPDLTETVLESVQHKVVIREDSSESDVEEDNDDDDDGRSTKSSYTLKELRQPYSTPEYLSSSTHASAKSNPWTARLPLGRGNSVALPTASAPVVTPPPGFTRPPGVIEPPPGLRSLTGLGSGLRQELSQGNAGQANLAEARGRGQETMYRPPAMSGLGLMGRGRGLPPQSL